MRRNKNAHGTRVRVLNLAKKLVRPKRSQQEIAGFVIIVVLVIIAAVIFLVIAATKPAKESQSVEIDNLLTSMLSYTTNCAISFVPQYSSMQDLVMNCYNNQRCTNINEQACDYLNETMVNIMSEVMKSESTVSAYRMEIFHKDSSNHTANLISPITNGNCTGAVSGSQKAISTESGNIIVRLRFCT